MIFFYWWLVGWLFLCLAMVAAGVYGLRRVPKIEGWFWRVVVGIASVGSALLGSLVLLILWAGSGCRSHAAPIYSPSGKMAVRIETADEGATGGETWVELYWAHGLSNKEVYSGGWASVEQADIRWKSDSKLIIQIRDAQSDYASHCASGGGVKVECSPRPIR
jgi:hypothetical protein